MKEPAWYERALEMEGRAALLPFQDTGGKRELAMPGVLAGLLNAFTAPRRAMTGNLGDPQEEAMNVAGMVMGGGLGASRVAPPPAGSLGMNVHHASPHRFAPTANNPLGEFDARKIGTGEGAQIYGHGHYLAENPKTSLSPDTNYMQNQRIINRNSGGLTPVQERISDWMDQGVVSADEMFGKLTDLGRKVETKAGESPHAAFLREYETVKGMNTGHLYNVDLPDSEIAKMLDWDKPLSQQPESVRKALATIPRVQEVLKKYPGLSWKDMISTGEFGTADKASYALREAGIPGIRYLDQGSRQGGKGTRNFVVFPGGETLLKILERK